MDDVVQDDQDANDDVDIGVDKLRLIGFIMIMI